MKALSSYSKRIHLVVFCCFLFPFFYTGCGGPSEEEIAAKEKSRQDSITAFTAAKNGTIAVYDTAKQKPAAVTTTDTTKPAIVENKDTTIQQAIVHPKDKDKDDEEKNSTLSEKIVKQLPILKPLLVPKEKTFSGIASVIDTAMYLPFYSVFLSFLLLVLSLVVKYMDAQARTTIAMLNTLALISLYVSTHFSGYSEDLWGFWVAFSFVLLLTAFDIFVAVKNKREKATA